MKYTAETLVKGKCSHLKLFPFISDTFCWHREGKEPSLTRACTLPLSQAQRCKEPQGPLPIFFIAMYFYIEEKSAK